MAERSIGAWGNALATTEFGTFDDDVRIVGESTRPAIYAGEPDGDTKLYYRVAANRSIKDQVGLHPLTTNTGTITADGLDLERDSTQYAKTAGFVLSTDAGTEATFECWFKLESLPTAGAWYWLLSHSWNLRLLVYESAGTVYLYGVIRDHALTSYAIRGAASLVAGTWYHARLVWERNASPGLWLYLDGASLGTPQNTDDQAIETTWDEFVVGADINGANTFDGVIDEVRFSAAKRCAGAFSINYSVDVGGRVVLADDLVTTAGKVWELQNVGELVLPATGVSITNAGTLRGLDGVMLRST